jgi:hypothetical protein
MTDVTHILAAIEQRDSRASEHHLPLVYEELRKLAAQKLARKKPGQTLEAAGPVHEAYLRLVDTDNRRYETASALAADGERYLHDEPVQARPPSAGYQLRKFVHRNKGPVLTVAIVLVVLVGGIVGTARGLVRAQTANVLTKKRLSQCEKGNEIVSGNFADLGSRAVQFANSMVFTVHPTAAIPPAPPARPPLPPAPPPPQNQYMGKSGKLAFFFAVSPASGQVAAITAVNQNPAIFVNGVQATAYGPVWASLENRQNLPFVAYSIPAVQPTDVVTYSAPAGWFATAKFNATAANNAPLSNYTGQLEPGIGGVKEFALQPSDMTMKVSFHTGYWPGAANGYPINPHKNWIYKGGTPWVVSGGTLVMGDGTSGPFGQPLSWSRSAFISQGLTGATSNQLDSRGLPQGACSGPGPNNSWVIIWDETNLANPMSFWFASGNPATTGVDVSSYSGNYSSKIVSGSTTTISYPGTSSSPGIKRDPNAPDLAIRLRICASSPIGRWTAQNVWVIAPGNVPTRKFPYAGEDKFVQNMTAPNGRPPFFIRMAIGLTSYGQGNSVGPEDLRSLNDFTWSGIRSLASATVVAVRYFNTTTANGLGGAAQKYAWPASKKIYTSTYGYGGTDPSGPPNSRQYLPIGDGDDGKFMDLQGTAGNGYVVMEFRTSGPHGLKTADCPVFPSSGAPSIPVITTDGKTKRVSLNNLNFNSGVVSYVTGIDTFVMCFWANGAPAGASSSQVMRVNSTTEIPVNFTITWSTPDWSICTPEHFAGVCESANANLWCNVTPFLNDAGCLSVFKRIKSVGIGSRKICCELGNETWGTYLQSWACFRMIGQLLQYLPNGTPCGPLTGGTPVYYNSVAGYGATRDQMFALRQGQVNDLLASVFGEANILRIMPAQFAAGSISAQGRIRACNAHTNPQGGWNLNANIPVGALTGSPYGETNFGPPIVLACAPSSTSGSGNWSCDMINEFYRHELKYDQSQWAAYNSEYSAAIQYVGPTKVGGVTINNGALLPITTPGPMQNKPTLIGYEASPYQPFPFNTKLITNYEALMQDTFYHPTYGDVMQAYLRSCQDGHPYIPGSGMSFVVLFNYGGGWGGQNGNLLYSNVIWDGQLAGPGIGITNTSRAVYSGLTTPSVQRYATAQGGAPANGQSQSLTNDLPGLYAVQQWMANSN